ncbi:MAG: hypothetical protein HYY29_02305 [Chloroflexi bacterium]|nr:hypothetical protein [Chloroflexota bacterium]
MILKASKTGNPLDEKVFKKRLDRLSHEIAKLRAALILQAPTDRTRANLAWKDLLKASEEVSATWSGPSALEEIREQREK